MLHYVKVSNTPTILIRGARQLLTLRGAGGARCGSAHSELAIIQDGSLLVRDGVIVEVGPTRRLENLAVARGAQEINAAGRVVMPGFVDSHTHLAFPPAGGSDDPEDAVRLVRTTNGQRLAARMRSHIQLMARHGTTTVEVKTGCAFDANAELKLFRALDGLKRDPLDVIATHLLRLTEDDGAPAGPDAADWAARELLPVLRRRRYSRFADVAWGCDPERLPHLARHLDAARALGFALKVHAEGPGATAAITAAVERFATSIDHLEHATPADTALLAGSCTIATLLPGAAFQHGGPEAPARALIDAGAPVALASNFNPRNSPMLCMQTVVALACLRLRMTPAEAVVAATINGAHALGRGDKTGSLEPGKLADIVILNTSDYRDLARDFGANLVRLTMKRGEFIYREGEVARRDDPFKNLSSRNLPGMRQ